MLDTNTRGAYPLPLPITHTHVPSRSTALTTILERALCTPGHHDPREIAAIGRKYDVWQLITALRQLIHEHTSIPIEHDDAYQIASWTALALTQFPEAVAAELQTAHQLGGDAIAEFLPEPLA